jgi:WD40 repeat protein
MNAPVRRRYPGAKPFEQSQQDIFFGRQTAVEELYRRLSLERLTVLYGKSGDGKSSLINAGIIPRVTADASKKDRAETATFLPVKIRFEAFQNSSGFVQLTPVEKAFGQLKEALNNTNILIGPAYKLLPDDTSLWAAVKNFQNGDKGILLIFDQFEELFTYPEEQYMTFGQQLAELINVLLPMRYARALEQNPAMLTPEENALLHRQPKVHVLLAIRSDRLNLLNRLQPYLPNIQKINFELPPLSKSEARDAILLPATEDGEFSSPAFSFSPGALRQIINALTDGGEHPIASFQLQILCESIEDRVMKEPTSQITENDIQAPALLYENYYRERIARLGNRHDQNIARRLIEDGLILEEENRRLSLYEGQIRKTYGVPDRVLQQLENDHLLRREPSLQGGYSYELSHDTLVKPIANFKKQRQEEERRREANKQRWRLAGAALISILAILAALWSYGQWQRANKQTSAAEKISRMAANSALFSTFRDGDPTLALNIAQYNYSKHQGSKIAGVNRDQITEDIAKKGNTYYKIFDGHTGSVLSVAFSPDGNTIISGGKDMKARLWNLQGEELAVYSGHTKEIWSSSFSHNGQYILTGSKDSTARLWDLKGNTLQVLKGHRKDVSSVSFSPDDQLILTASDDSTAKLWSLEGKVLAAFKGHRHVINTARFAPDGQTILTGSNDKTAKLWDLKGRLIRTFEGHTNSIFAVGFSPDGRQVLTGSADNTVMLWNINGTLVRTFRNHSSAVTCLAFTKDGKRFIAGAKEDGDIRMWDIEGHELRKFPEHRGHVSSLAISPDGRKLVSGGYDTRAIIWYLSDQPLQTFETSSLSYIRAVAFSPDGKRVATASSNIIQVWSTEGQLIQTIRHDSKEVDMNKEFVSLSFSPDGKKLVAATYTQVMTWDASSGQLVHAFKGKKGIQKVSLSPDGSMLLVQDWANVAVLYRPDGTMLHQLFPELPTHTGYRFSPDSQSILTGLENGTAVLQNLKGDTLHVLRGHFGSVEHIGFFKEGDKLFTIDKKKTIRIWSKGGQLLQTITNKSLNSDSQLYAFSPSGREVLTGHEKGPVRLINLETGMTIASFPGPVYNATFSPDGQYIAMCPEKGLTTLWRVDKDCLECGVYQFSLQELWDAGVQLEPEDLKTIGQKKNKE